MKAAKALSADGKIISYIEFMRLSNSEKIKEAEERVMANEGTNMYGLK